MEEAAGGRRHSTAVIGSARPPQAAAPVDTRALRRALGAFATGVAVMTTRDGQGHPWGLTVNSFSSVSLDPPLVLWSLSNGAPSLAVFRAAGRFVVNILAQQQVEVSRRFAARVPDRFDGVPFTPGLHGLPVIAGCAAHLECSVASTLPGGDHTVFLGHVERFERSIHAPLVFACGQYHATAPLVPDLA